MKSSKNESDSGGSTIEQTYQKKTPLEHILLRPDTYVGSIEEQEGKMWVWESDRKVMKFRNVKYVPGLYKIFDEILVNASDNFQRDKSMNKIEVTIDPASNMIKVWNNGRGIPVAMHQEYKVFVPELIFGQLLTSSNYDDSKKKTTGGRNGYGAKLTNVFSKKFIVETADAENQKKFIMEWRNNMSSHGDAKIEKFTGKQDFTCITFYPDLERFHMNGLDKDIVDIMTKRVYDLAGVTDKRVKVVLNGEEIKVKSFTDYIDLYIGGSSLPKIFELANDRWQIGVTISEGVFQQVSFVNGICTNKGGTHVTHVADQVITSISELIQKKFKKIEVKNNQIKQHLWIFVNCLIENPCFDSQTKDTMTLKASSFGSRCEVSEKFLKEVLNCGVIDHVMAYAKAKTEAQLGKKVRSKKNEKIFVNKLEDANDAGGKNGKNCTLILTEGDSAKTLAMAGIEVVGRDTFGVFPLKGKLLNVREATHNQLMNNEEIQNIMKIVGLEPKKDYSSVSELRYGSIMIMADQDLDGSHIKGLVINFIHFFWPSLLKCRGFMTEFITPIVKVTKGSNVIPFYTIPEFETWLKAGDRSLWKVKYYKGLGTSQNKEAQEYFSNIDRHRIEFVWSDDARDNDSIELAFNKKRADDRKTWLANLNPDTFLDMSHETIGYSDFIHKELILFSNHDNIRSIPSLVDGLKPGQRKILFCCFKRKLKAEIKVAQLSGYVGEHSAYHHGEMSLASTIVGLAQNFVGSNNLNLLLPLGQFGTRGAGGKDMASARYIFTNLSPVTRCLFINDDDYLLNYQKEDGQSIEPVFYVPIIPLVLVNGSDGIGTGWSTSVPQYNPFDLIEAYRERIKGKNFVDMSVKPWYKGYTGKIEWIDRSGGGYEVTGIFTREREDLLRITDLPIKKWTSDYKKFLEDLMKDENPFVTELKEYHTENRVDFLVRIPTLPSLTDPQVLKKLKLQSSISMNNLVLFSKDRKIQRYASVNEIMEEHFLVREDYYKKRKEFLISKLTREVETLNNKVRFILAVINEELIIRKKKKVVLVKELLQKGFATKSQLNKIFNEPTIHTEVQEAKEQEVESEGEQAEVPAKEYDYLLGMPMWSLTYEKVEALKNEQKDKVQLLNELKNISIFTMWENDLKELEKVIKDVWLDEENDRLCRPKIKAKGGKTAKAKKPTKKEKEKEQEQKKKNFKPPVTIDAYLSDKDDGPLSFEKLLGKPKPTKELASESSDNSTKNPFAAIFKKQDGNASKRPPVVKGKVNAKRLKGSDVDSDSSFDL